MSRAHVEAASPGGLRIFGRRASTVAASDQAQLRNGSVDTWGEMAMPHRMSHTDSTMSRPTQLTLRGIDERVQREIRALARKERISLNKAAVRLLEKGAGVTQREPLDRIGSSLDHLIGTWSASDANALLSSIEACEQIDEDLWR